ncbi:MAG TPA: hypothetical protein VIF12_01620 [Micavibrio sp.]
MANPTPYDGTRIFKPVASLENQIRQLETLRAGKMSPMARQDAGQHYKKLYQNASSRLSAPDMLTLDQAAKKLSITSEEYVQLADRGDALLIEIQGLKTAIPSWQFGPDDRVDPLKLDIAREFVLEGEGFFRFLDFINFMSDHTADITPAFPEPNLCDAFQAAGAQHFQCTLTVKATMNQLADRRQENTFFRDTLVNHLDKTLTHGSFGDPLSGGLSRPFRNKYGISGPTHDEAYAACISDPPKL